MPELQYSETTPTGQGPSALARLNTDTGAGDVWGALAHAGQQFAGMGANLTGLVEKVVHAENVMALSTLQRKDEEARNAATQAMAATQDPDEQAKISAKYQSDSAAMAKGQRGAVQTAFTEYHNRAMPTWQAYAAGHITKTKIKNLEGEARVNEQSLIESGNIDAYAALQYKMVSAGLLTKIEADHNVQQAPILFSLSKLRKLSSSSNMADLAAAEKFEVPGELTDEQTDYLRSRKAVAEGQKAHIQAKNYDAAVDGLVKMVDLDPVSKASNAAAMIKDMQGKVDRGEITAREGMTLIRQAESFMKPGKAKRPDYEVESDMLNIVLDHDTELDKTELNRRRMVLMSHADDLQGKLPGLMEMLDKEYNSTKDKGRKAGKHDIISQIGLAAGDEPIRERGSFIKHMYDIATSENLDEPNLYERTTKELALWNAARAKGKATFTQAHIAETYGTLQGQGITRFNPITSEWDFVPFKTADEMRAYARTRFGPEDQWDVVAPQTKAYINAKFPGTFKKETPATIDKNSPDAVGITATNANGDKVILKDGKWVPLK
jgi:hypothetical protein